MPGKPIFRCHYRGRLNLPPEETSAYSSAIAACRENAEALIAEGKLMSGSADCGGEAHDRRAVHLRAAAVPLL